MKCKCGKQMPSDKRLKKFSCRCGKYYEKKNREWVLIEDKSKRLQMVTETLSNNWGGRRAGAGSGGKRPGAGRPKVKFSFDTIGSSFVIERGAVNDLPSLPEVWEIANVTDDYFELQRTVDGTSEIITVSKIAFWNGK